MRRLPWPCFHTCKVYRRLWVSPQYPNRWIRVWQCLILVLHFLIPDTISMVILALRCVVQDHRHRSLIHFVRRPMAGLARQQHAEGSFGSLTTTALAIQARTYYVYTLKFITTYVGYQELQRFRLDFFILKTQEHHTA